MYLCRLYLFQMLWSFCHTWKNGLHILIRLFRNFTVLQNVAVYFSCNNNNHSRFFKIWLKSCNTFCKLSNLFMITAGWACLPHRHTAVADTLQSVAFHTSCQTCLNRLQWHFLWESQGKYANEVKVIFGIQCQCFDNLIGPAGSVNRTSQSLKQFDVKTIESRNHPLKEVAKYQFEPFFLGLHIFFVPTKLGPFMFSPYLIFFCSLHIHFLQH